MKLSLTRWFLFLIVLTLSLPLGADRVFADDDDAVRPAEAYAVRAKRIYVLDRTDYLENAWMVIRGGKIDAIGTGDIPDPDLPVVDFRGASLLPGLVSTESRIFIGSDRSGLGAQYVAGDKFNPFADFRNSWVHGVTTARLTPPGQRFVGGIGSVVRFGGTPETSEVLVRDADLQLNFNDAAGRGEAPDAELRTPSSMDVPYRPAERRRPDTRLGRIIALEKLLADASKAAEADDPSAKLLAFHDFVETGRPFRIDAERAGDIRQALEAAKRTKLPVYVAGAYEAQMVAEEIAAAKIPVVVDLENGLPNPALDAFDPVTPITRHESAAAALERLGVEVIIGGDSDDLLMSAAMAVKGGMTEGAALRAITARPAKLLGVSDRVGRLARGMDADFIVVNGDPLRSTSRVQQAWVLGSRAWSVTHAPQVPEAIVVRAGRIYDGRGHVFEDGEVLIEGGKIVAVGHRVQKPAYANFHDAGPEAVVTPGFIDVHSNLGLEGDSSNAAPGFDLGKLFQVERPSFADVARSGITTVVVTPRSTSTNGTPFVAIKPARGHGDSLVAKANAGLALVVRGNGDKALKSLDALLNSAEAYHKQWLKYEQEYAAWLAAKKAGKLPTKAAPAATPAKKSPAKKEGKEEASDALSGTWLATLTGGPIGEPMKITVKMALDGKSVSGSLTDPFGSGVDAPLSGTFDGKTLDVVVEPEDAPFENVRLRATMTKPEELKGKLDVDGVFEIDVSAKRTAKGKPKITVKRSSVAVGPVTAKGPKKPKKNERLEPFRAIFAGKAGIMFKANSRNHVEAVVSALSKRDLPFVIHGGSQAHEVLGEFPKGKAGVAVGRALTRFDDKRRVLIPDELDRAGVTPLFQSDGGWGASKLPRLLRAVVRAGLSPETALRSMTYDAARLLRLDDKVGSLSPGRDGDLLIFDGEPFDARTSLKTVMIRGKEIR